MGFDPKLTMTRIKRRPWALRGGGRTHSSGVVADEAREAIMGLERPALGRWRRSCALVVGQRSWKSGPCIPTPTYDQTSRAPLCPYMRTHLCGILFVLCLGCGCLTAPSDPLEVGSGGPLTGRGGAWVKQALAPAKGSGGGEGPAQEDVWGARAVAGKSGRVYPSMTTA